MCDQDQKSGCNEVEGMPVEKITVGRTVHVVLKNGKHRPAVCVETFSDDMGNFVVFMDGYNDKSNGNNPEIEGDKCINWRTSLHHSSIFEPDTWHWPERE